MNVDWSEVTAVATAISALGIFASALFILGQLRQQGREQFVSGTQDLFRTWMEDDFQRALQWVQYDLSAKTWAEFATACRGQYGERAFQRVGGYYNRIGYLVTRRLLGGEDRLLLDTVAGSAIAIWNKIEPLVLEARLIDDSSLFQDYQRMLPRCYECYVPGHPVPARILAEAEQAARLSEEEK